MTPFRQLLLTTFVATLIFSLPMAGRAQGVRVGSVNMRPGMRFHWSSREHDWTFGTNATRFGFEEFRDRQWGLEESGWKTVSESRFTIVHCGPTRFNVRARMWIPATVAGIVLAAVVFLIFAGLSRIPKRQNDKA